MRDCYRFRARVRLWLSAGLLACCLLLTSCSTSQATAQRQQQTIDLALHQPYELQQNAATPSAPAAFYVASTTFNP